MNRMKMALATSVVAAYYGENWRTQGYLPKTDEYAPENNRWGYKDVRDLTPKDEDVILTAAAQWIDPELEAFDKDVAIRNALDYAIKHTGHGVYDSKIGTRLYEILVSRLIQPSSEK